MGTPIFNENDIMRIKSKGIKPEKVLAQIEIFKKGASHLKLNRPCTPGDGIRLIKDNELKHLADCFEKYCPKRSLSKFVPASGAASRMFKTLLRFDNEFGRIEKDLIVSLAREGDKEGALFIYFFDNIQKFAFYDDLKSVITKDGFDLEGLIEGGRYKEIISYLLEEKGLGYSALPKGLIKFHKYSDGNRTPFEEQLVEATDYIKDKNGICHLHFTVSPEHKMRFAGLLDKIRPQYEKNFGACFNVDFSIQEESTDTIAVDLDNNPFRLIDDEILFRPGGHGALIENLNAIKGDIVYIKNIDNIVPDRLKGHSFQWKRILGGCLFNIQQEIFSYLEKLTSGFPDKKILTEAIDFAEQKLYLTPEKMNSDRECRDFLVGKFNRPIRVCGMVKNIGEPGGGPFWVEAGDGTLSLQIVENAQVDRESEVQQEIFASSTHFNPVDIVCGLLDFKVKPFDLRKYVDSGAVFISHKSKHGRDLKALELPGLWNGAMSGWNTIFVEVPLITFNPVKTVNDLIREQHQ